MSWLLLGIAALAGVSFLLPVLFGPPYLPTLKPNLDAALELMDLKPGQTVLDLGSGDGRVLLAAAQRGWNAVGIELSLLLVLVARLRTWRYRKQVRVLWGNYFQRQWPPADGIFSFTIQYQMAKLDRRVEKWRAGRPIRLCSVAFRIPGKKPSQERRGVFLYEYK